MKKETKKNKDIKKKILDIVDVVSSLPINESKDLNKELILISIVL